MTANRNCKRIEAAATITVLDIHLKYSVNMQISLHIIMYNDIKLYDVVLLCIICILELVYNLAKSNLARFYPDARCMCKVFKIHSCLARYTYT